MAQKFLQSIDLNGLELQNAVLQPLGTPPDSPSIGRMYFHSTDGKPYWYDGSKFITFPSLSDVTTLQGYFTNGKANDSLKLGGVALDGLFTALSTSTTNAVSITVGGISKNITVAELKTSLGLKGLAYKDTIEWSLITTKPNTLAGYGITDAASGTNGKANDSLKLGGVALDGLFTALSTNTTNAVSITVGGTSKNITVADLKTSLGLKGLAYKDSLVVADIPAIPWDKITANTRPTTLTGYGITDAYTKTEITDVLGSSSNPALGRSCLNFTNGVLVKTKITDGADAFLHISITGNSYQLGDKSFNVSAQIHYYGVSGATNRRIDYVGAVSVGDAIGEIKAFAYEGKVCLWIPNPSNKTYQGFNIKVVKLSSQSNNAVNEVDTLVNTSMPTTGVSLETTITPYEVLYTTGNQTLTGKFTVSDLVTLNGGAYIPTGKSLQIGEATFTWDSTNGVLMVDKPFASTGAISTKGIGSSSGGGGSVDLTNIVSNILPSSGSITSGVSSYNIGSTDKRWGTVYANVGNFNNLSASGFSAQSINASTINIGGVSVATLTDINDAKAYAQQVANEAANSIYNTLLGGEVDESLDTIKEILDYVKDLDSENIVVKKTSTITGNGTKNSFDFQHNLNTKDVIVFVYEVSNPYQQVFVDVKMTSTSTITVEFAEAPANGASYKVVVMA